MRALILLALLSCQNEAPIAPPISKPTPGAMLAALPAPLEAVARTRRTEPVDLGIDRSPIEIDVPDLPRGGAAAFTVEGASGWATRIPESKPLPALAYGEGKIFASGGFDSRAFYALDAKTGAHVWSDQNLADNGPTAAIYDQGDVIFNTESCTLFVADAKTGRIRWHRYLGDPTLAQVAAAEGLIFSSYPDGTQRLGAYRVKDGSLAWSRRIAGELLAAPIIQGDSVYVSTMFGMSYRFLRANGRPIWKRKLDATTAPWIDGDRLFVTVRRGKNERQIVASAATGEILREDHEGALHGLPTDPANWRSIWEFEGSRPVVIDGVRYEATAGEVRASDPSTGDTIWHRRYRTGHRSVGTVAVAGSQVVIATRDGKLFGLDVDTGYTAWAFDTKKRINAEPIIADGWVYAATTDGYVVAIQVGDSTLDGWHMFGGNPHHNGVAPRSRG